MYNKLATLIFGNHEVRLTFKYHVTTVAELFWIYQTTIIIKVYERSIFQRYPKLLILVSSDAVGFFQLFCKMIIHMVQSTFFRRDNVLHALTTYHISFRDTFLVTLFHGQTYLFVYLWWGDTCLFMMIPESTTRDKQQEYGSDAE